MLRKFSVCVFQFGTVDRARESEREREREIETKIVPGLDSGKRKRLVISVTTLKQR